MSGLFLRALLFALCPLLLLVGCTSPRGNQAIPSSDIRIKSQFGEAKFLLPKDQQVDSIHYERTGTNTVADLKGLKSANNADVINQSWVGVIAAMQAQNARLEMFYQALMFGANKAGNYFGLPTTPIPPAPAATNGPPIR